jgi:hypothetical protein
VREGRPDILRYTLWSGRFCLIPAVDFARLLVPIRSLSHSSVRDDRGLRRRGGQFRGVAHESHSGLDDVLLHRRDRRSIGFWLRLGSRIHPYRFPGLVVWCIAIHDDT